MAVESAADRAVFVDADDFGTTATYTPAGGVAATIEGLFDEPPGELFGGGDEAGLASAVPMFTCRAGDVPAAAEGGEDSGDVLTLTDRQSVARRFQVMRIALDGAGFATLTLEDLV